MNRDWENLRDSLWILCQAREQAGRNVTSQHLSHWDEWWERKKEASCEQKVAQVDCLSWNQRPTLDSALRRCSRWQQLNPGEVEPRNHPQVHPTGAAETPLQLMVVEQLNCFARQNSNKLRYQWTKQERGTVMSKKVVFRSEVVNKEYRSGDPYQSTLQICSELIIPDGNLVNYVAGWKDFSTKQQNRIRKNRGMLRNPS